MFVMMLCCFCMRLYFVFCSQNLCGYNFLCFVDIFCMIKQVGSVDDKDICFCCYQFFVSCLVVGIVYFNFVFQIFLFMLCFQFGKFIQYFRNEWLFGKVGIDSYDCNFIGFMDIVFYGFNWCFWVKDQFYFYVMMVDFINQVECLVVDGFWMQSDEICFCMCQLSNVILRLCYYQMIVEWFSCQFFNLIYEEW